MDELSIGVDVEEIERFRKLDLDHNFYRKVFTDVENEYCKSTSDPHAHFAARFAAKEAVRKATKENLELKDIEVRNREDGSPYITIRTPKVHKKYRTQISLAHSKELAIAFCIVSGGDQVL